MRVLILSANTGGGHNSTAGALAEQLEKMGVEFEIADALSMISERVSQFVSWGHSYVYRHLPSLFGHVYRYEERHPAKFIYEQCAKGAVALQEKLRAGGYDAVVCVHVFSCMMMTEVRRRFCNLVPNYFVATDYTCSPGVTELRADVYFIPHRMLFGEFVRGEVAADKMFATGIPIRSEFYRTVDRTEARRALGLRENGRLALLSCGSIGCGHLNRHALLLAAELPADCSLAVLCGKNEKLYAQLEPYRSERLAVVGFTSQIPLYMSAADVYLTKPGGLMTTEAIAKGLPMVFVDAVPGCETRNFEFLTARGVALGAKNWKQAISMTAELLAKEELAEQIRAAMASFQTGVATEQICRYIVKRG